MQNLEKKEEGAAVSTLEWKNEGMGVETGRPWQERVWNVGNLWKEKPNLIICLLSNHLHIGLK